MYYNKSETDSVRGRYTEKFHIMILQNEIIFVHFYNFNDSAWKYLHVLSCLQNLYLFLKNTDNTLIISDVYCDNLSRH